MRAKSDQYNTLKYVILISLVEKEMNLNHKVLVGKRNEVLYQK